MTRLYSVTIPVTVQPSIGRPRSASIALEVEADDERDAVRKVGREIAIALKMRFQSAVELP